MNLDSSLLQTIYPAAAVLAGIFFSLELERLARPSCPGLSRPLFASALHAGLLLMAWAVILLIVRRPVFALLLVLAGQFLVIQVNNAKYRALREPFLFSDFGIFSQTLKHPRLYLPFLGVGRIFLAAAGGAIAVAVGWFVESPAPHFIACAGGAAMLGLLLIGIGWTATPRPSFTPERDVAAHGLFTSIARYWLREKTIAPVRRTSLPKLPAASHDRPDIVVIQSESFFDARRLFSGIRRDVLENYDTACASAYMHGRLQVPAWGANTMRPEFCFLTGLASDTLDVHRFNPYRRVARRPIRALPAVLREAGYRTACIHPHPARFFRRDRAFPNLGFEHFMDIREFRNAKKRGPYTSDEAVTDKLIEELSHANGPVFLFAITMENHGPLHLEKVSEEEIKDYFTVAPPQSCSDLQVYIRHLKNADQQLGRLRSALQARSRPYVLAFYGEHMPSMPDVYQELGFPDGRTDYFVDSTAGAEQQVVDLEIAELPRRILGLIR